jgi:hypothetical protein
MKLRTQLSVLVFVITGLFVHAQGRGKLIKMERREVVKIASVLKKGMTEAGATQYLTSRGLEPDWTAIETRPTRATNLFEVWYLYGTNWAHIENLRLTFHARRAISFEDWQAQHPTNSSLVAADIYVNESFISIALTNAP